MSKRTTVDNEIAFKVWITPMRQFVEATFSNGRVYTVHGHRIVLFPINIMALAIGRDRETIVKWEQDGRWPKSKWKIADKRTKRWYSKAQILEAHRIHWKICGGDYGLSHSKHFDLTEFHKQIKATFHKVDAEFVRIAKQPA